MQAYMTRVAWRKPRTESVPQHRNFATDSAIRTASGDLVRMPARQRLTATCNKRDTAGWPRERLDSSGTPSRHRFRHFHEKRREPCGSLSPAENALAQRLSIGP